VGEPTRFAVGLILLWFAALCLFFALHPGGVSSIKNPVDAIQWMIEQFNKTQGGTSGTESAATS
jgi:hypothetical protein